MAPSLLRLALAVFLGLLSMSPRPAQASDCGLSPEIVPDFSLVDANPNSPTQGQTYTRDALLGQVLVIYWAQAT